MKLIQKNIYLKLRKELLSSHSDTLLSISKICIDELNKRRIKELSQEKNEKNIIN